MPSGPGVIKVDTFKPRLKGQISIDEVWLNALQRLELVSETFSEKQ